MIRFVVCLLAAFACFFAYATRLNLSFAVKYMFDDAEDNYMTTLAPTDDDDSLTYDDKSFTDEDTSFTDDDKSFTNDEIFPEKSVAGNLRLSLRKDSKKTFPLSLVKIKFEEEQAVTGLVQSRKDECIEGDDSQYCLALKEFRKKLKRLNSSSRLSNSTLPLRILLESKNSLDWNKDQQKAIKEAFFLGYVVAQIPGTIASGMYGTKLLMLITGLGSGLCTIIFPMVSKYSYDLAYAVRVLMGATQASLFPSVYILFEEWLPDVERFRLLALPSAFSRIGQIMMPFIVDTLVVHLGWESIFYFYGGLTLVWCLIWCIVVSSSPRDNYWISKTEKFLIEEGKANKLSESDLALQDKTKLTSSVFTVNQTDKELQQSVPVDWLKLAFRTKSIWLLTLVMFASEWSNFILMIELPSFMKETLRVPEDISLYANSFLHLIYVVVFFGSGFLSSMMAESNLGLTTLTIRKMFEVMATSVQGTCCIIMALGCKDHTFCIIVFSVMMFGRASVGGGQCLIPAEISSEHSGIIFAFANTIAASACLMGPSVLKWMVSMGSPGENLSLSDPKSYIYFWWFSASIFYGAGLLFLLLADNRDHNLSQNSKHIRSKCLAHISGDKIQIEIIELKQLSELDSS